MRPSPETFDELAQSVLRNYLRSALIIDDQWPEGPVSDLKAETPDESALIDDQSPDSIEPSPVSDPTHTSPASHRYTIFLSKSRSRYEARKLRRHRGA